MRIEAELKAAVEDLDAARLDGHDAVALTRVGASIERLGATVKAFGARRCATSGAWARDLESRVPAVSPAEWLADLSGSSIGVARDALAVTEALHEGSATDRALRSGVLSLNRGP